MTDADFWLLLLDTRSHGCVWKHSPFYSLQNASKPCLYWFWCRPFKPTQCQSSVFLAIIILSALLSICTFHYHRFVFFLSQMEHLKSSEHLLRKALCSRTCKCSWSCRCFEETSSLACLCLRRSRLGRWSVACALRRLSDPQQDTSRTASRSCILLGPSVRKERKKLFPHRW